MFSGLARASSVFILILALAAPAAARGDKQVLIEARIVQVASGDTMQVLAGPDLRDLRIAGVIVPAPGQPLGNEARDFTRERVSGKEVTIEVFSPQEEPFLVGDILLPDDSRLSYELLARGFATWDHLELADPEMGRQEMQARTQGRGQWGAPMMAHIPVLRQLFRRPGPDPDAGGADPAELDRLAREINALTDGDRARLSARLGGAYAPGTTTIIGGNRYPGQAPNGARIVERSSGRSSNLGIGFGDDGVVLRGGAAEHSRQSDTQIEVFGAGQGGTLIIENGVVPGGYPHGGPHGPSSHGAPSHGGSAVYASGGKFHRASCFGGAPTGPALSRSAALNAGLSPCSTCRP